ncbi:MAG: hypothetical protein ACOH2L_04900 [Devosia sp.]
MSSQSAPAHGVHPQGLTYNLAGIAVLVLLLAVGAAYLIDALGRSAQAPSPTLADPDPISQTISGRELAIPTRWFRFGDQIHPGFTNQIDLRIVLAATDGTALPVDVTLLPRSRARTSATLLDAVYLHQFADTTLSGVPGLVGKPMQDQSGYVGASVWYDALSPNPFVAKCLEAVAEGETQQCVRTVYLPSGIAAIYAFDATVLQSWRRFDPQMEQWLTRIGAY